MVDILFLTLSAIAVALNIAPLCWQIQHRNSGPICLGIWLLLANINILVNGIVWRNDATNRAPIFCDISVKIQLAAPIGIVVSKLAILLLLARVVGPEARLVSQKDRRRRAIIDYVCCFGLPIVPMACHIIWQPFRFGIAKTVGCAVSLVNTWPMWALWLLWLPVLSFIGCLLSGYVGWRLVLHRRDFRRLVNHADSALSTSRFVRLGLLCTIFLLLIMPISIFQVVSTAENSGPFIENDWRYIHSDFNFVAYSPLLERAPFQTYSPIIAGILHIIFFGFGTEAFSYYLKPIVWLGLGRYFKRSATTSVTAQSQSVTKISLNRSAQYAEAVQTDSSSDKARNCEEGDSYSGPFHHRSEPASFDMPGIQMHVSQESRIL